MHFTRAKAVTAATIAALSGLTAVALASNGGSTPNPTAAAPTTPIIEHRTEVIDRTVHRTKTVSEDAKGKVTAVRTTTDGSPQAAPAQPAARASAPAVQRTAPAPTQAAFAEDHGEDRDDDHGEDRDDDRYEDHGEDRDDDRYEDHGEFRDDDGDDD